MKLPSLGGAFARACLLLAAVLVLPAAADPLSPAAERGKRLYNSGVSDSGRPVFARIGSGDLRLPASTAPCGSCHGEDGKGRPEGGVVPSDITWDNLTKHYGGYSASGRRYPPYDAGGLARLLAEGVDPGGNRLESLMPRYEIAAEDVLDLVAYLKVIDRDFDPGIDDHEILIGTLLPLTGEGELFGVTLKQVMDGYFADINAQGGVFNRKLRLKAIDASASQARIKAGLDELFAGETPFAILGAYAPGHEALLRDAIESRKVPAVGAFSRAFDDADGSLHYGFYLFGDMDVQGRALVHYARLRNSQSRPAVLYAQSGRYPEVGEAMLRQAGRYGWDAHRIAYPVGRIGAEGFVAELQKQRIDAVFFAGPSGDLQELLQVASAAQWVPSVYALGTLSAQNVFNSPSGFSDKLFLAYPTAPSDQTADGMRQFREFHSRHQLPRQLIPAQIAVYSATSVLVEGLKRAGRDLSRAKLIAGLENLYEFNTGLTPKMSFHANRHVGAPGAHIISVDLQRGRYNNNTTWIEPD